MSSPSSSSPSCPSSCSSSSFISSLPYGEGSVAPRCTPPTSQWAHISSLQTAAQQQGNTPAAALSTSSSSSSLSPPPQQATQHPPLPPAAAAAAVAPTAQGSGQTHSGAITDNGKGRETSSGAPVVAALLGPVNLNPRERLAFAELGIHLPEERAAASLRAYDQACQSALLAARDVARGRIMELEGPHPGRRLATGRACFMVDLARDRAWFMMGLSGPP